MLPNFHMLVTHMNFSESSSVGEEERSGSVESHRSVTSPQSSASCGKKARKARTIFTDKQLQVSYDLP